MIQTLPRTIYIEMFWFGALNSTWLGYLTPGKTASQLPNSAMANRKSRDRLITLKTPPGFKLTVPLLFTQSFKVLRRCGLMGLKFEFNFFLPYEVVINCTLLLPEQWAGSTEICNQHLWIMLVFSTVHVSYHNLWQPVFLLPDSFQEFSHTSPDIAEQCSTTR